MQIVGLDHFTLTKRRNVVFYTCRLGERFEHVFVGSIGSIGIVWSVTALAPATMAPAEGLGAVTHDGTTTEGNGAVGAGRDGVGAADISYLATRSADAEKLRRSSSRDVECDLSLIHI